MAPPDLAADAPVADVVQPVVVGLFPLLREDGGGPVLHGLARGQGQGLHAHEPLLGHVGLDDRLAAVALAHVVRVLVHADEQAQGLQVLDHGLAAGLGGHAPVLLRGVLVHVPVLVHDRHDGQAVLAAQLPVVHVVGGRDLQAAGAEVLVHVGVGDDGQFAVHQGQAHGAADGRAVAGVLGVHRHRGVAQHGLGPGGGHGEGAPAVGQGVRYMVERALLGRELHLVVGQGGVAAAAPVDDVLAAVDEALVVEAHEHRAHGLGQAFVHGEPLPGPVHGRAQPAHLVQDAAAVLLAPLPDPFDELLAAQLGPGAALGLERALHHVLGGDARVVRARHPQHLAAALAVVPAQHVLQGDVERVADVQLAGHVWGRDDDGVGLARPLRVRGEGLFRFPVRAPARFHVGRVVGLVQGRVGGRFRHQWFLASHPSGYCVPCAPAGRGIGFPAGPSARGQRVRLHERTVDVKHLSFMG